jgi:hypothetical protein
LAYSGAVCGNIVHNYFGRANPSFETIDGELWLLVDFTVGRDISGTYVRFTDSGAALFA